jgi:hypothetical protein
MFKPGQGILSHLKNKGRSPTDLPLNVLREFQEFEKVLAAGLKSYEGKDPAVTYGMQSFTKLEMLAVAMMMSDKEFVSARRCYEDIMRMFKNDDVFSDGISLMSWIIFNFPASLNGKSLGSEILERTPQLATIIGPFVEEGLRSRLGLYEVVKDGREACGLKELFTGRELVLNQTLGGIGNGSITLCRVMEIMGKNWVFGDTFEIPVSRRNIAYNMVKTKMSLYYSPLAGNWT